MSAAQETTFEAFAVPDSLKNTPLSSLSLQVHGFFLFALRPSNPTIPLDFMTAGDLSDWIWSSIEKCRKSGSLPFEIGHLRTVCSALCVVGFDVPAEPAEAVSLLSHQPRANFHTTWNRLASTLGIALPKPASSLLGCFFSLLIAAVPYILFLVWFDQITGPLPRFLQRSLGWIFFFAALALAVGISKLLAAIFPDCPHGCDTTSQLAAYFARHKPLPPNSPHLWTESLVWLKTQSLVAALHKTTPNEIERATPIVPFTP